MAMQSEKASAVVEIVLPPKTAIGSLVSAASLFCLVFLAGCGYTLIPPALPSNPTQVFLLDHGRHSSLVLPADNEMIRYSYGDWDWYVLNKRGVRQASRALFISSPAALARQKLPFIQMMESLRLAVPFHIEEIYIINVEVDRVKSLHARLETVFIENEKVLYHIPGYRIDFVPYPEPYSISHNSNNVVAQWLLELGVEVRGGGPFSRWKLKEHP